MDRRQLKPPSVILLVWTYFWPSWIRLIMAFSFWYI